MREVDCFASLFVRGPIDVGFGRGFFLLGLRAIGEAFKEQCDAW
jgi:hypothetical protein